MVAGKDYLLDCSKNGECVAFPGCARHLEKLVLEIVGGKEQSVRVNGLIRLMVLMFLCGEIYAGQLLGSDCDGSNSTVSIGLKCLCMPDGGSRYQQNHTLKFMRTLKYEIVTCCPALPVYFGQRIYCT